MTLLWKSSFNFAQVLADQAIWAVCGRAAAVVDMSSVPKQTVAVEVMPLVGGHLRLPKVRLSRYVEGASAAGRKASAANMNAGESTEFFTESQLVEFTILVPCSNFLQGDWWSETWVALTHICKVPPAVRPL